jgi:hypothetical protein
MAAPPPPSSALGATGAPPAMAIRPAPKPRAAAVWVCPMHPEVRRAAPGSCPLCGMDLVREAADAKPAHHD